MYLVARAWCAHNPVFARSVSVIAAQTYLPVCRLRGSDGPIKKLMKVPNVYVCCTFCHNVSLADQAGFTLAAETIAEADEPEADTPVDDDVQTVTVGDTLYTSALTFEQLNLSPQLLEGLYTEMKFNQPSRIQGITLPLILNPPNRSLIAQVSAHFVRSSCAVRHDKGALLLHTIACAVCRHTTALAKQPALF